MKTLLKLCLFLVAISCLSQAQKALPPCDSTSQTISATNLTITISNDCRGMTVNNDFKFAGSPASSSIVTSGCTVNSCSVLETYTGNVTSQHKLTVDTIYLYFKIVATLTGGTSPTVVVTPLITTARGNSSSGGGTWGSITGTLLDQTDLQTALNALVPATRTVAGHALSSNVTLAEADISSLVADLAAKVPTTTTVGGHALSSNVTLVEADITNLSTDLAAKNAIIARSTISKTTASLANNANEAGSITSSCKSCLLLKSVVSVNARIRIYSTAAGRDADVSRTVGVSPPVDEVFEAVQNSVGTLTLLIAPVPTLYNMDGSVVDTLYYNITNLSGGTSTVAWTGTIVKLEQ